jgi:hypothetical protein
VFLPEWIGRREKAESVCQLSELVAESVVFVIFFRSLNPIALYYGVGTVGFV